MEVSDRAHLLDDSFAIAETGALDYSVPLDISKYLGEEDNYVVWKVATSNLGSFQKYFRDRPIYPKYQVCFCS